MELFKSVVNVIVFDILGEIGKMLIADNKAISIFCFVSDLDN
jgi:hypothetical protein